MQTYDDLLRERDALLLRVEQLSEENRQLRLQLAQHTPAKPIQDEPNSHLATSLSAEEKIQLFQSRFRGRTDVFARRWHSKNTNKSGYQPVCQNEWHPTFCDKKKHKCADCPNRQFAPLDNDAIYKHLEGKDELARDVIGLYPILEDNTCHFLCADFDDKNSEHGYQSDVQTFVSVCRDWGLIPAVERSRSGNGAHVWLFFEQPTPSRLARKLGFAILTEATNRNGRISFKSYDRFFPNQDQLPEGGLGNLVALPLQGQARKQGNSLFVDDNFSPYPDQWDFLRNIPTISSEQLDTILQTHTTKDLGELASSTEERPWLLPKSSPLTQQDFPSQLTIVQANGLYIPLNGLSAKVINHLKRIASFKNPEFYTKQAMRFSTFSTPRIICCAELSEDFLVLPRGCEDAVTQLLESNFIAYRFEDQTYHGQPIHVTFNGQLRDEQQLALSKLTLKTNGTLSANTAFGKTVTAAALIASRQVNTLILVHTKALLEQWKNTLSRFLSIEFEAPQTPTRRGRKKTFSPIGTLDSSGNHLSNIIDIVVIQSCINNDDIKDFIRNYGMVIVDECHHVSAVQFERVLRFANAQYVYGLTATPIRKDGHQPIIFMQCGPIRYTANKSVQHLSFTRELRPRFTAYKDISAEPLTYTQQIHEIANNELRNRMIISDVCQAIQQGRTPIILTQLTAHVHVLAQMLTPHCQNVICLTGSDSTKQKRLTMETLRSIPSEQSLAIIATGKYIGEGFDFPRLDTLFLTLPIAWKGLVAQYTGRLHREYDGKDDVIVYDYIDIHVPLCEKMYRRRLKGYAGNGYQLQSSISSDQHDTTSLHHNTIFSGIDFAPLFLRDLRNAKQSILIYTPSIQSAAALDCLYALQDQQRNGCSIQLFTQDIITAETENQLDLFSVSPLDELPVTKRESIYLQCAIIDRHILWYGDINYLDTNTKHDFSMRLTDASIAEQVISLLF